MSRFKSPETADARFADPWSGAMRPNGGPMSCCKSPVFEAAISSHRTGPTSAMGQAETQHVRQLSRLSAEAAVAAPYRET